MTNETNGTSNPEVGADSEENLQGQPMVEFTVFDEDGRAIRNGKCPANIVELQAMNPGETVMEGLHADMVGVDPEKIRHTIPRGEAYPSIGDQLDVLWKMFSLNPQLLTPEGQAMLDRINAVKAKYPKTATYVRGDTEGEAYIPTP